MSNPGDSMNVSLTPELKRLVDERVDAGRYASASEVVREALRLLDDRDTLAAARLEAIRSKVALGLESLDAGRFSDSSAEDIIEKARAKFVRG